MAPAKRMLNVLIKAAVLWAVPGCAQFIMRRKARCRRRFNHDASAVRRAVLILMLGFVHGDRIFRVLQTAVATPHQPVFLAVWRALT